MLTGLDKNLIPAIENTKSLVQVFIIILFFESYFITLEQKSLLNIDITFEKIHIAPFIHFFFFIAVAKVIWLVISGIRIFILSKYTTKEKDKISASSSFRVFLFWITSVTYLTIVIDSDYLPINKEAYPILTRLFISFCFSVSMIALFIFISAVPDSLFEDSE